MVDSKYQPDNKSWLEEATESPSPERPLYSKVKDPDSSATQLWIIRCDEGWRESIVCEGMYEWAADWLVDLIQGKPFALGYRP